VLKKDEYTVGRHANCSYVIKEEQLDRYDFSKVSEKHFKIVKKKDGVFIEDIGGTYINNKKVGHGLKSRISHNDYISITQISVKGKQFFLYSISHISSALRLSDFRD
jgi:FOG: FHA domain